MQMKKLRQFRQKQQEFRSLWVFKKNNYREKERTARRQADENEVVKMKDLKKNEDLVR